MFETWFIVLLINFRDLLLVSLIPRHESPSSVPVLKFFYYYYFVFLFCFILRNFFFSFILKPTFHIMFLYNKKKPFHKNFFLFSFTVKTPFNISKLSREIVVSCYKMWGSFSFSQLFRVGVSEILVIITGGPTNTYLLIFLRRVLGRTKFRSGGRGDPREFKRNQESLEGWRGRQQLNPSVVQC